VKSAKGQPPSVVVLAAVEEEMEPLRALLERRDLPFRAHEVVSGIGKASAAAALALAIARHAPALVLQTGCAGAFPGAGLELGDVVVATGEVFGDEGVEAPGGFLALEDLGLGEGPGRESLSNEVPTDHPSAEEWRRLLDLVGGRVRVIAGRLLTVSTGSGTDERSAEMSRRWGALAESMEGAAAALVARRMGAPFLEVRGISNFTGRRRRESWKIEAASSHAALVASHLLAVRFPFAAGEDAPGGRS
jgi:futalosine hydrolase